MLALPIATAWSLMGVDSGQQSDDALPEVPSPGGSATLRARSPHSGTTARSRGAAFPSLACFLLETYFQIFLAEDLA